MGSRYYLLLLTLILITKASLELLDERKLGCLVAPEICIPPEDCDSATGNCEIPYTEKDWENYHEGDLSSLVRLLDILKSQGYDIDRVIRSLISGRQNDQGNKWYGFDFVTEHGDRGAYPFESFDMAQASRELRRSVSASGGASLQKKVEVDATGTAESTTAISSDRLQHIKTLVRSAELALARKGKTLNDLNLSAKKSLADFLAKLLLKEEKTNKKTQKTSENLKVQSGRTNKTLNETSKNSEGAEVGQPVSDVRIQEQPGEFPGIIAQPKELNDVEDVPKSSVKLADPPTTPSPIPSKMDTLYIVVVVVGATVLLIILVTIISCIVFTYRMKKDQKVEKFISGNGNYAAESIEDYKDICRQHYASINSEVNENHQEIIDSGPTAQDPLITRTYPLTKPTGNDADSKQHDGTSLSSNANATRNSSVSSVSWSEEPVTANLDITTGHAVLSYMEDHLNNRDRLGKEWEEICGYEAENVTTMAAINSQNARKNRSMLALPYDHNRVELNPDKNHLQSDYINASAIIDNDPKRPLYIATQGPLPSTIPDFWQMMWENGCAAIVMLTPLVEEGVNQCARYWPDEGSCTYHNFEIHLVSEHIWCEDYLVRSLYLKHLGTGETRTVTQFHFLSWPKERVPSTPKPLLELRRKVTKCYKGHNSPVLVHCGDGVGRTGTYILLDLAIDRMLKGAKEIDIAATLEHIRDQRVGMVANKEQFEFALTAVAEEVNAILKTLLH